MASFSDKSGRVWQVAIDVASLKQVRVLTGVEIGKLADKNFAGLAELFADVERLVNVLYVLCREQADAAGVNDEAFGRGLGGDQFEKASDAFYEAFTDFCRSQSRTLLRELATKGKEFATKATEAALTELRALKVESLLTSKESVGNSPASSALTPAS